MAGNAYSGTDRVGLGDFRPLKAGAGPHQAGTKPRRRACTAWTLLGRDPGQSPAAGMAQARRFVLAAVIVVAKRNPELESLRAQERPRDARNGALSAGSAKDCCFSDIRPRGAVHSKQGPHTAGPCLLVRAEIEIVTSSWRVATATTTATMSVRTCKCTEYGRVDGQRRSIAGGATRFNKPMLTAPYKASMCSAQRCGLGGGGGRMLMGWDDWTLSALLCANYDTTHPVLPRTVLVLWTVLIQIQLTSWEIQVGPSSPALQTGRHRGSAAGPAPNRRVQRPITGLKSPRESVDGNLEQGTSSTPPNVNLNMPAVWALPPPPPGFAHVLGRPMKHWPWRF